MSQAGFKPFFLFLPLLLIFPLCRPRPPTPEEYEEIRDKSVLIKLDLVNVSDFVSKETMAVVFYYKTLDDVKWVPWLERALPAIPPTHIGMVHCHSETNYFAKQDCVDLGLSAPCIRIYRYGYTLGEYDGKKTARDFVSFVRRETPTDLVRLDDVKTFENFLNITNRSTIVGFFAKETDLEEMFIDAAKTFRGPIFAYSTGKVVLEKMGFSDDVVLFRPKALQSDYEPDFVRYDGTIDMWHLREFIRKHQHGLVGVRDYFSIEEFPKPLIVAYFDLEQEEQLKKWRNLMLPVAKEYSNITFAISQRGDFLDDLKRYGIDALRIKYSKVLVLAQTQKDHKYVLDEFKTKNDLRNFAYGLENNVLPQFVKTQQLRHSRPHSDKSAIYFAVGSNFMKLINERNKDLLIMFYTFECSGNLINQEFVAQEFEGELNTLGFIAMNVALNDVPFPYYFDRCPTFFFAGRDFKDDPVLYGGSPDYRKLQSFVKEQRRLHEEMRDQRYDEEEY